MRHPDHVKDDEENGEGEAGRPLPSPDVRIDAPGFLFLGTLGRARRRTPRAGGLSSLARHSGEPGRSHEPEDVWRLVARGRFAPEEMSRMSVRTGEIMSCADRIPGSVPGSG